MLKDEDNPLIPGSKAAREQEEKEKKKTAEDESNPLIPGSKAAEKELERERQEKFESPATNPFMKDYPGAKPIDTELSLEDQMKKHDAITLGGKFILVKEATGKLNLISQDGQTIEVTLAEVEKFRDNPDDLKDLFPK